MSAGSPPAAVPVFYSQIYADPPECSLLPQPPESWYLKSNNESTTTPIEKVEEKVHIKPKSHPKKNSNNRGFYSPFSTPRPYVSVRA